MRLLTGTVCVLSIIIGVLLFDNNWLIPILSIYFSIHCPTDRITDESAPIIACLLYYQYISSVIIVTNIVEAIQSAVCYMVLYWMVVFFLSIILPRYKLEHFKQPKEAIIEESKKTKCGLTYYLEHDSPTNELFDKLGQRGDDIADDLWPDLIKLMTLNKNVKSKKDMDPLEILLENVDSNPKFKRLIDSVSNTPSWCNWKQLDSAQRFHQRLSLPFAYVLGICTLVGGFGCPEINKVLISSRYWANNNDKKSLLNTLNRLRETSVWLYTVMRGDVDELKPFGLAWKSILRVRLFHAKIRYQLSLKRNKTEINDNPANNEHNEKRMVPINSIHLIGTLIGFQYTPLVVLKTIFGMPILDRELENYTQLWRYIGFILGCVNNDDIDNIQPLKSFGTSRAWMARIWDNLINPDIDEQLNSTTLMLSHHVLKSIAMSISDKLIGKIFSLNEQTIEAFFRAFLTEDYANMIQLSTIHWSYELQIRVIIACFRIIHIVLYQLHLNWISVFMFKTLWTKVMIFLNYEVLEKREKYHCRFAKYCGFNIPETK